MAKDVKVVMHGQGARALLRSPEVLADVRSRAEKVAADAGPGHRVEAQVGAKRARAAVITDTLEARLSEAHHGTLTRAIGGGGYEMYVSKAGRRSLITKKQAANYRSRTKS